MTAGQATQAGFGMGTFFSARVFANGGVVTGPTLWPRWRRALQRSYRAAP